MPDYTDLVRALNDVDAAARAATAVVDGEFTAAVSAVTAEVTIAEQAVRESEAAVRAAERDVNAVDERSRRLWKELAALLGWRGRRLGGVPSPALDLTSTKPARKHLDRAAATIARSALGQQIAPIPRGIVPLLPPGGAAAALLAVLMIHGITALVGSTFVHVIAQILIFFAPFTGVPLLAAWTGHHYGTRPEIAAIALTTLGGMIASCAMVLLIGA